MIKKGDNVILKFSTMWDGELCRDHGKAYIYPSMKRAVRYCHPDHEVLVEYAPVKHGHWILRTKNNICDMTYQYECSQCKQPSRCRCQTKFCPHCGAIMDGDINE